MADIEPILTSREIELYTQLVAAAKAGELCPARFKLKSLAIKGILRVESYVVAANTTYYCRVVTILTGEHSGLATYKPQWVKSGQKPTMVYDIRSTSELHALGLCAPSDLVDQQLAKPVTLGDMPPWLNKP